MINSAQQTVDAIPPIVGPPSPISGTHTIPILQGFLWEWYGGSQEFPLIFDAPKTPDLLEEKNPRPKPPAFHWLCSGIDQHFPRFHLV